MLVEYRVAELIQNTIEPMRILLKPGGVTDRAICRDPWIGDRRLLNDRIDVVMPRQFWQ